jgi:hypothetical protein
MVLSVMELGVVINAFVYQDTMEQIVKTILILVLHILVCMVAHVPTIFRVTLVLAYLVSQALLVKMVYLFFFLFSFFFFLFSFFGFNLFCFF